MRIIYFIFHSQIFPVDSSHCINSTMLRTKHDLSWHSTHSEFPHKSTFSREAFFPKQLFDDVAFLPLESTFLEARPLGQNIQISF